MSPSSAEDIKLGAMHTHHSKQQEIIDFCGLGLAISLAAFLMVLTTPFGLGLGNDSPAFTGVARKILQGNGFVSLHHPPLYSWLMATLAELTHLDVFEAARILQHLALAGLVAGVWFQLAWTLPRHALVRFLAALLVAVAFPVIEFAGNIGSDLLGASLAIWTLGLLALHLTQPTIRLALPLCVLLASLALLNRFAGFGLVLAVSFALWLRNGRPWGRDLIQSLAVGFVMVFPCSVYILVNKLMHGQATSRVLEWNSFPWDRLQQYFSTMAQWFLPSAAASWASGCALFSAGLVFYWRFRNRIPNAVRIHIYVLIIFAAINLIFLLTVISLADNWLALDHRTLLPLLPTAIMAAALLSGAFTPATRHYHALVLGVSTGALAIALPRAGSLTASYMVLGRGHTAPLYRNSRLVEFIASVKSAAIATNNPPMLQNLTGVEGIHFPVDHNMLTNRPNLKLESEIKEIRAQLRSDPPSYLVIFAHLDNPRRVTPNRIISPGETWKRILHEPFVSVYETPQGPARAKPKANVLHR